MPDKEAAAAVVTDASQRVGLHVIRALGRAGLRVHAVEIEGRTAKPIGFLSRYTSEAAIVPNWERSPEAWLEGLLAIGKPGDVLVPCCLNTVLRVLAFREQLADKFRFLLPEEPTLRRLNDKWELYKLALERGVPVPATYCPDDEREVARLAESIEYPAIVKLRHDEDLYAAPSERYAKAASPEELVRAWRRLSDIQERPVIQEYVKGVGYGYECLYGPDGRLLAEFTHKRLVEYPPSGGPSAVCQSVWEPLLLELGVRLMVGLEWRGVAMLQLVRELESGRWLLLEVNPRFWGSLPLAEAAGVNFPYLYYLAALGEAVCSPNHKRCVRMRLMPTYLRSLWLQIRARPWAIFEWGTELKYLFDPRVREGMFCLDDLKPAFRYVVERARGG